MNNQNSQKTHHVEIKNKSKSYIKKSLSDFITSNSERFICIYKILLKGGARK